MIRHLVVIATFLVAATARRALPQASAPASPQAPPQATPAPDPRYSAADVVGIILDALQHNDTPTPDHGIATTFSFASPENQRATGPLERFTLLVKNPQYRPMLGFRRARRDPITVSGGRARQRVVITDADGHEIAFVFQLSRQAAGAFARCWMTDGVVRVGTPELPPGVTTT
jgi:hypothetical protein